MKNVIKLSNIIAIAIITIGIVVSVIACDDKPTNPVACNCEQTYGITAHLGIGETCPCPASKPCGCTEQTAWLGGIANGVKIRKEIGITVEQMLETLTKIEWAYEQVMTDNDYTNAEKTRLTNIPGITLVSGSNVNRNVTPWTIGIDSLQNQIRAAFRSHAVN
jgi:uncharacterized lipoprotein YehR (DUF1307 family)